MLLFFFLWILFGYEFLDHILSMLAEFFLFLS